MHRSEHLERHSAFPSSGATSAHAAPGAHPVLAGGSLAVQKRSNSRGEDVLANAGSLLHAAPLVRLGAALGYLLRRFTIAERHASSSSTAAENVSGFGIGVLIAAD